jgi:hypothetical protein
MRSSVPISYSAVAGIPPCATVYPSVDVPVTLSFCRIDLSGTIVIFTLLLKSVFYSRIVFRFNSQLPPVLLHDDSAAVYRIVVSARLPADTDRNTCHGLPFAFHTEQMSF